MASSFRGARPKTSLVDENIVVGTNSEDFGGKFEVDINSDDFGGKFVVDTNSEDFGGK